MSTGQDFATRIGHAMHSETADLAPDPHLVDRLRAGHRRRHTRRLAAGAAGVTVVAALSVLAVTGIGSTGAGAPTATNIGGHGVQIQLAGFEVTLPAGYAAQAKPCPWAGATAGATGTAGAASTKTGDCVQVVLDGDPHFPAGKPDTTIKGHDAYVVHGASGLTTVLVKAPAVQGYEAFELSSRSLTAAQLEKLALPFFSATPGGCTGGSACPKQSPSS